MMNFQKNMEGGRGTEERKYVQISNSTITDYAGS